MGWLTRAIDVGRVAAVARATLNDPRGWSFGGSIAFDQVSTGGHFQVLLASSSRHEAAAPICSARYSCRVGDEVLVNDVRWRSGTPSWTRSLEEYQRSVIIHDRERNAVADRHGVLNQHDTQAGVLQAGDRGNAVIDWQSMLRARNPGALLLHGVDGVFGPETEKGTWTFQRSRGIQVDGLIGPQTRRAMKSTP